MAERDTQEAYRPDAPGFFVLLAIERQIHECLELPAVSNLDPPLQQGWNRRILRTSYSVYLQE